MSLDENMCTKRGWKIKRFQGNWTPILKLRTLSEKERTMKLPHRLLHVGLAPELNLHRTPGEPVQFFIKAQTAPATRSLMERVPTLLRSQAYVERITRAGLED